MKSVEREREEKKRERERERNFLKVIINEF